MLKCVIIEDEFPAREELKFFIEKHNGIEVEKEFDNPLDALKYLQENETDIAFLDINMPELDGMSLGKILSKLNKNLKIVFITAYKEYAAEAFEIKAFDYLLKPYSEKRINEVLSNLTKEKEIDHTKDINKINKVTVTSDEKMYVISIDDIYYIEAGEKESMRYTKDNFYRTHRSYMVNLDKITEVEPWFNGTYVLKIQDLKFKIPVSRNNIKEFKEILVIK